MPATHKKSGFRHNVSTAQSLRPSSFHLTNGSFEFPNHSKPSSPMLSSKKKKERNISTTRKKSKCKNENYLLYSETQRFLETKKKSEGKKMNMTVDEKKKKKKYCNKKKAFKFSI